MRPARTVIYHNREVTLSQLAELTGREYKLLLKRWNAGDREPAIWREPDPCGRKPGVRNTAEHSELDEMRSIKRRAAIKAEQRSKNAEERRRRTRAVREAVAAFFALPLFDATLVSDAERREIEERVRFSGQRGWRVKGSSLA